MGDFLIGEQQPEYDSSKIPMQRTDIQPRAQGAAHRILTHMGFEIDYRAGEYSPEATDERTA